MGDGQPLCISSVTGQGIKGLWKIVLEACEGHVEELTNAMEQGGNENDTNQEKHHDDDDDDYDDDYNDDYNDSADSVYSQGYDWIQGSVMYEGEKGDQYYEEDDTTNDINTNTIDYDDDDDDEGSTTSTSFQNKNRNRNSRDGNNDDNNDDVISENNNNNSKRANNKNNNKNIPQPQQKETLKYLRKKA